MKPQIKIYDTAFAHSNGGSFGTGDLNIHPTHFEWYRGKDTAGDIAVITESCFNDIDSVKEKIKIALIMEPPCIRPDAYVKIKNPEFRKKFDYILTHQLDLLLLDGKFRHYTYAGCWIYPHKRLLHPKTKNISIIASSKKNAPGHILRHQVISSYRDKIDGVFGNGYDFVTNKIEALKDYRYSIVIENEKSNDWFTEKLIDCFITGTIPIYWGTKNIGKYFNSDGIIQLNEFHELKNNIEMATKEFYDERMPAILQNYETSIKYVLPEDLIWTNFLKDIYESPARSI